MLLSIVVLLFWPLLQGEPSYIALSKFWKPGSVIETGLHRPMATVTCPTADLKGGWLVAADSSGEMVEMRFADGQWQRVRPFATGAALTTICSGAAYPDLAFRLYAGTRDGGILEISRGPMGWYKREILRLPGPVRRIRATEASPGTATSQFVVVDGEGNVTHFWMPNRDVSNATPIWQHQTLPSIPGGAADVCVSQYGPRLWAVAATAKGEVYRFRQDSLGQWSGDPWAAMPAGAKSLAASADPTMRDVAVFYSGADGIFRYLFFKHTKDAESRVPPAATLSQVIGSGNERRFNEFFGVSGKEFCMFDYNFEEKVWDKVPFGAVDTPVVATTFGNGRGQMLSQMFVTCANGKIYEFVRDQP